MTILICGSAAHNLVIRISVSDRIVVTVIVASLVGIAGHRVKTGSDHSTVQWLQVSDIWRKYLVEHRNHLTLHRKLKELARNSHDRFIAASQNPLKKSVLINLHSLEAIRLIHNNSALEGINHSVVNSPFIIVYMKFPCSQATFTISAKLLSLNESLQEGKSCTGANKDSNEDKKRSHLVFFYDIKQ